MSTRHDIHLINLSSIKYTYLTLFLNDSDSNWPENDETLHLRLLRRWERTMPLEPRLMPTFAPSAWAFKMPSCTRERKNWKKKHITVCVCRIPQKLTWSNSLTLYPSLSLCIRARFAHSWRVWRVKVTLISQCCSIARSELICKLTRFGVNCCQDRLCRILRAKESVDIKVDQANWTNSRCNLWVKTFLFDIWHWWKAFQVKLTSVFLFQN